MYKSVICTECGLSVVSQLPCIQRADEACGHGEYGIQSKMEGLFFVRNGASLNRSSSVVADQLVLDELVVTFRQELPTNWPAAAGRVLVTDR